MGTLQERYSTQMLTCLVKCKRNNTHFHNMQLPSQEQRASLTKAVPNWWLLSTEISRLPGSCKAWCWPCITRGEFQGWERLFYPGLWQRWIWVHADSPGGKSSSRKLVNCKGFRMRMVKALENMPYRQHTSIPQLIKAKVKEHLCHSLWWCRSQQ